jgi:MFS family permease
MPVVAADLDAGRDYGLAFSLFLTTALLGSVVSGGWCDARGPAGPARTGVLLFGSGLLVCGLAHSFPVLLAGRALAGLGGGLIGVALYVVIAAVYSSAMQPRMFSWLSAGWVLPGIVGPVVAGWLAENVSWRAVFLLVPPLAIPPTLALLPRLGSIGVRGPAESGSADGVPSGAGAVRRITGGVGLAGGVLALQWGLGGVGRLAGPARGLAAAAAVAGIGLALTCFTRLVPPGALTLRRGLPAVITLRGLYAGTFFGVEAFIPLMLVTQRGLSPTQAGLVLTSGALGWTAGSFLQARPGLRVSRSGLLVLGATVIGLSQALLVLAIRPPVPAWAAIPVWALTAFGMGVGTSSTNVVTLRLSAAGEEGRNSAALQLSDALGGALGIGLTGAAFAIWHRPASSDAALFTWMWLASGAVALVGALIGLRTRAPAPAEQTSR